MRALLFCLAIPLLGCSSTTGAMLTNVAFAASPEEDIPGEALSHYIAARVHRRNGNFKEAIRELRLAADLAPKSLSLQLRIIRYYIGAEQFENAREVCERAEKHNPENVTLKLWLGAIYGQLKRFDEAIDIYQKAIVLDPENVEIYSDLIKVEESINDLTAALDSYEALIKKFPDNARLWFRLGINLVQINDAEGAKKAFMKTIELSKDTERPIPRARYVLGILYMDNDENAEAIPHLKAYLEARPDDIRGQINLAGALARLHKYSEAIAVLDKVVESDPSPLSVLLRMFLLYRSGQYEVGASVIPPNEAPYLGSLFRTLYRKQLGEPYRPILDSLDMFDGDLEFECNTFVNEIVSLFGRKDAGPFFEGELKNLRKDGVRSKVIDTFLGRAYMTMGEDEQAVEMFRSVIDTYGSDKTIHYYLATVLENLDRTQDVEHHLKAYLKLDPGDPDVLNFLGYLYAEENMKLDEAEEMLHRALEADPENGFYLDSLGWIYYRKGDGAKAVELIQRAIRAMNSDDAILRDHLGDAYLLKGDAEHALEEWRRARKLDAELEGVEEKLKRHSRKKKGKR